MKNIIAISLGVAVGVLSIGSYADTYDLGRVEVKAGSYNNIKLTPLRDKFIYNITCNVLNHGDNQAAIKVSQKYNNFGAVTLNGEYLNKNSGRETVQGLIKSDSVIVIYGVNDNSGTFRKDYLIFDRSLSNSKITLDISCRAEASHNPTPTSRT
ncbi:MAG: hypothetical protein K0S27_1784 [Gammaproteobacteria bacterium]|jgi:hypothetical protein|nr:hypothetical protein [Gammaproteobacteria bacterium]